MSLIARGTFDIVITPSPAEVGAEVDRFDFTKTFGGDLDGTSGGVMLSCGDPGAGSAGYVAMELSTAGSSTATGALRCSKPARCTWVSRR
jgi:hypothetical protein